MLKGISDLFSADIFKK